MTTTGIVLAGGRSSRFGGSKLAAELGGRTVLDRSIDAVASVSAEVIVVGGGAGDRAAADDIAGDRVGARHVADAAPFGGPLAGLVVGLEAARGDVAVVVGGDMPLARPAVLGLLVELVVGPTAAAVVEAGAELRPLPMAVRREAALEAANAALDAGERSLRSFLGRLEVAALPTAAWRDLDPEGDTLLDVDTPEDLARARARLDAAPG